MAHLLEFFIDSLSVWDGRRSPKSTFYALIGVRNTEIHLRRRRVWNKAFNTSHVKAYEPILRNRLDQLLNALQTKGELNANSPVDLAEWISFFAYVPQKISLRDSTLIDMILWGTWRESASFGRIENQRPFFSFGGGFELMREGDVNGMWKMMEDGVR